jgi:anti-sigma factor RsiW
MMNEPFSEELLSAYVDGELSASERAEVERRLEQDPQARDVVDELRRLSQMFEGLSRSEVPHEFHTQVLQSAERRMLLPEPAPSPGKGRGRGSILAWAAPLAAAAVLVLTLQIFDVGGAKQAKFAGVDNGRRAEPQAKGRKDLVADQGIDAPAGILPSNFDGDATADRLANPQLAAIDEAVHRIVQSRTEDKVLSVVKVYVADRANGLVLMQKILEDNNIPVERGEHPAPVKADAEQPDRSSRNDALYIVAEPEELIAAFTEMLNRRHPDLRVDVEGPVELALLDSESKLQFEEVEKEFAASNQRREEADFQPAPTAKSGARPTDPGSATGRDKSASAGSRPTAPEEGLESVAGRRSSDQKPTAAKEAAGKKIAAGEKNSDKVPDLPAGPPLKPQPAPPKAEQAASTALSNSQRNPGRQPDAGEGEGTREQMANFRQNAYSNSRQAVVNLPPTFDSRQQRAAAANRQSPNPDQPGEKPRGQNARASAPTPTESSKLVVEDKQQQQPALVRMLIVIEPEGP